MLRCLGNYKFSYYCLLGLVLSLPLFEAPKNIFLVLFVINGAFMLFSKKNREHSLSRLTQLSFVCFVLSAVIAGWNTDAFGSLGALHWVLYPLAGLSLLTLSLSESQLRAVLLIALVGVIISILETSFWSTGSAELRSVGYRTQSSIYVAFTALITVFFLVDRSSSLAEQTISLLAVMLIVLFLVEAKTAIGWLSVSFVLTIATVLLIKKAEISLKSSIVFLLTSLAVSMFFIDVTEVSGIDLISRFELMVERELMKSLGLWETAFLAIQNQEKWFGYGLGQFGYAVSEQGLGELAALRNIDPSSLIYANHGHGAFTTILVERGLVGATFFILGIGSYLIQCYRMRRDDNEMALKYIDFGILGCAYLVFVGLVQTTFHLEHGLLGFLIIGISLSLESRPVFSRDEQSKRSRPSLKIFAFGGSQVPSTRFRVMQYLPTLSEYFECEVIHRKPRFYELVNSPNQIVVLQKRLLSCSKLLCAKFLARGSWVYDFDDAVWVPSEGSWSVWTKLRVRLRLFVMFRCVEKIHVSSEFLAQFVPARKRQIVPVSVPNVVRETSLSERCSGIVFGWSGKPSSAYQIKSFVQHIPHNLFDDIRLIVLSGSDPELNVNYEYWEFSPENEKKFYEAVDVGIVPSTDSLFDRGKTPVKALQHFSHSKTVISNPVGAASEFITRDTAIIVEGQEWEKALKSIVDGMVDLKDLSGQAVSTQRARYSQEVTSGRLIELFNDLLGECG